MAKTMMLGERRSPRGEALRIGLVDQVADGDGIAAAARVLRPRPNAG